MSVDLTGVDVMDMLERLEARNSRMTSGGDEANFSCFGNTHSHGDESPSAYMNLESTLWFCHGCKSRGSAVHLVMMVQNVPQPAAERWLRETYGIEFDEPMGGSMVAETEMRFREKIPEPGPTPPPSSWLYSAKLDWDRDAEPFQEYMTNRGFSPETMDEWLIGYDYLSDRLTIPVFGLDGELVGIKGRDWTGQREPKYMILGDRTMTRYGFQPYESSEVVFGLNRAQSHRHVVLCEGELNAIALQQMGVKRPIATGMSYFSQRHADLVIRSAEEVTVFYDGDTAGREGVEGVTAASGKHREGVRELLEPFVTVRIVREPNGLDPADYLEKGRADEALELIETAPTSLALQTVFE